MNDAEKFLDLLSRGIEKDERIILTGFKGDPDDAPTHSWKPIPWKPGKEIPFKERHNVYATVASFGRAADRTFRRRREGFIAGRALMVDDVRTKVHIDAVKHVPPTAIVETSPGNEQWWYILKEPERDFNKFDGVISAFIRSKLLGADPGMAGVTRVGRLPGFTNGKKKHNGFVTNLKRFKPDLLFTTDDLLKKFNLQILGQRVQPLLVPDSTVAERIAAFKAAERFLRKRKMLKRTQPDKSGWTEMRCPWIDEHTNAANTGAAIREPAPDNAHSGAFVCHHGHCAGKGWKDLTDWIGDIQAEELDK
jgi:hypothetical protein